MRKIPRCLTAALAVAGMFWAPNDAAAQSRTARTIRFESTNVGQVTVAVLLPVDYDSSTRRYPVLYLLHGGTQNHTAFAARSWFVRDASERRMIIVMPHLQPVLFSGRRDAAAPVEDLLGRELPAYVDSHYRTIADRRGRAIAGISMGGYGATLLGVKRPDMFAAVGAISAALSTGTRPRDVETHMTALALETAPYFYIACGVLDPVLPGNRDLAARLRQHGIQAELREVPGGHGWEVWDPQVRTFLDVLGKMPGWATLPD